MIEAGVKETNLPPDIRLNLLKTPGLVQIRKTAVKFEIRIC